MHGDGFRYFAGKASSKRRRSYSCRCQLWNWAAPRGLHPQGNRCERIGDLRVAYQASWAATFLPGCYEGLTQLRHRQFALPKSRLIWCWSPCRGLCNIFFHSGSWRVCPGRTTRFNYFRDMLNDPQHGIRADSLWINRRNIRLAALYRAPGWLFDGLEDCFYFRALGP